MHSLSSRGAFEQRCLGIIRQLADACVGRSQLKIDFVRQNLSELQGTLKQFKEAFKEELERGAQIPMARNPQPKIRGKEFKSYCKFVDGWSWLVLRTACESVGVEVGKQPNLGLSERELQSIFERVMAEQLLTDLPTKTRKFAELHIKQAFESTTGSIIETVVPPAFEAFLEAPISEILRECILRVMDFESVELTTPFESFPESALSRIEDVVWLRGEAKQHFGFDGSMAPWTEMDFDYLSEQLAAEESIEVTDTQRPATEGTTYRMEQDSLRTPQQLLSAFGKAAAKHQTGLRVMAFRNTARDDGLTTIPASFLPTTGPKQFNIGGTAKAVFGPSSNFYGVGGAHVQSHEGELNIGFVIYGPSDDEAVATFRELGNEAGVAVHAYDLVPGIQTYNSALVLWCLVVYRTLHGSAWLNQLDSIPESPGEHFNPFTASVEALKRLVANQHQSANDIDLIADLLAGRDNRVLTDEELAYLEAHLKVTRRRLISQYREEMEAKRRGELTDRQKLEQILEYNKNLQARRPPPSADVKDEAIETGDGGEGQQVQAKEKLQTRSNLESKADGLGDPAILGFLGGENLRNALRIDPKKCVAFDKAIERLRVKRKLSDADWMRIENPRRNGPHFLYNASAMEIIELAKRYRSQ